MLALLWLHRKQDIQAFTEILMRWDVRFVPEADIGSLK
jgi:hypothetical protein